jgi:hypothetical protein
MNDAGSKRAITSGPWRTASPLMTFSATRRLVLTCTAS